LTAVGVELGAVQVRAQWRTLLLWLALSRLVVFASFGVLGLLGPRGHLGPEFFRGPLGLLGA